ncbi:MAG: acetate--CoA ligase family protein [Gammaproteobacteria bacterium]|nr:acetate--CoA ligase family protein [Gammaproteobacteria bacterium]
MSFESLFYPDTIAVIGASRKLKTVGNDIVKNLVYQGFSGMVYPINPKADELYGKRVYANVLDAPSDIDLAVIAVPAPSVVDSVKQAHQKGARAAVVISAGCKEIGNDALEYELTITCQERNMLLVGPNCLGVINPKIRMNASFANLMPAKGNIAFISQSGALCTAVLDYAKDLGIGFSKFMSIGNKASMDELRLLKYFAEDPETKVIALYVEQLKNAPEIIHVVQNLSRSKNPKPVILLKSGKTEAGAGAIASHTGSLSGGDAAYSALFDQAGMIRASSVAELFNLAQMFSKNELKPVHNVTIITNAGGPGVLTTDVIVDQGLSLAQLTDDTVQKLKDFLPFAASTHNPVDILGDAVAERYQKTLEIVAQDANTEAIIVLLTPQSMTEIEETARAIIEVHQNTDIPIVVSFMGRETVAPGVQLLKEADIVTTAFPEPAAKALACFGRFVRMSTKPISTPLAYQDVNKGKVAAIFGKAEKEGKTAFPEAEAIEILKAYNFPLLETAFAKTADEAFRIAQSIGDERTTFAMKIVSPDILHKSDVGGVMLNIAKADVAQKFNDMMKTVAHNTPQARLEGVLLVEMAPQNGIEVILGVNKESELGTMIMFGLGGIYVEVLKDICFGFAPLTREDAIRMINSLRSSALFKGVRGQKSSDQEKMIECIGRLSQLVQDFPQIVELDINPLLVLPEGQGAKVLDARMMIETLS